MQRTLSKISTLLILLIAITACSTTSHLDEDEQLYTGMRKISYTGFTPSTHYYETQAELEAALACAPNGAFFGSSYFRTPFPYSLWIWNAFSGSKSGVGKWLAKTLGNAPVLISDVNPELRSTVAETVLQNNGYFRGNVSYDIVESDIGTTRHDSVPRPLKGKIAYSVDMGPLFTIDSISYNGFSPEELKLISSQESVLHKDDPFSIANLDAERTRIYNLLRENGYYYYNKEYVKFFADTLRVPEKIQLQLHKADSIPEVASKRWIMGRTYFKIRREQTEQLTDTVSRRFLTVVHGGKHSPLRPRVVLRDMRLRPGDIFCQSELEESMKRLTGAGIFSAIDISFQPRYINDSELMVFNDSVRNISRKGVDRNGASVLDMTIDCILDKPYDLSLQADFTQKTSGLGGPGVGLSFGRRNAFRGGEMLTFNLSASADFPIGNKSAHTATSYDIHGDVTLEMPRMLAPNFIKPSRKWYSSPVTLVRLSMQTINRSGFYRRNIISSELSYNFRPTETIRHTFTPFAVDYSFIANHSARFDSIANNSWYSRILLQDNFIPKMRYTFSYTSPLSHRNPIGCSLSFTEAGNLANAIMSMGSRQWSQKDKQMFGVAVSQFVKAELDWRKTWAVGKYSKLVAHCYGGYIYAYGNSTFSPTSEMFYMGGANDLRGFATRSVGPGAVHVDDREQQYVISLGNMKLLASLEYRPRLFGSLYGAIFIDAGNSWLNKDANDESINQRANFSMKHLANDIAVDAGIGFRYDLDFFVLRLDWGFIVHAPYATGSHGYFNTPRFSQAQCLNFAIGYPF